MGNVPTTSQFKKVKTPSGKIAFEAYTAVAFNAGRNIAICAPDMEGLKDAWEKYQEVPLIEEAVQHVWITEIK